MILKNRSLSTESVSQVETVTCEAAAKTGRHARTALGRRLPRFQDAPAARLATDLTSPSFCVLKAKEATRLSRAIQQLPHAQQQVIVLHYLQGQLLSEVADQMQRSQSTVAGLLYRGLKSFARYWPPNGLLQRRAIVGNPVSWPKPGPLWTTHRTMRRARNGSNSNYGDLLVRILKGHCKPGIAMPPEAKFASLSLAGCCPICRCSGVPGDRCWQCCG